MIIIHQINQQKKFQQIFNIKTKTKNKIFQQFDLIDIFCLVRRQFITQHIL
jgi:hypothetical protein